MNKLIIIDDEPLARTIIKGYLNNIPDLELVAECANGFEGAKAIAEHHPDLVILDIQMPKINGFEMLELIEKTPEVIFATAFDEYAIKAFENNAVDYLLKPFSKDRFDQSIEKWRKRKGTSSPENAIEQMLSAGLRQPEESQRVVVKNQGEINIVPVADIHYIEAFDDYVKIFTKDTFFLKKKTMVYYEQVLDPRLFFRAHRSFIISLPQLARIEPLEKNTHIALLKSGKKIPLSRTAYAELKIKLGV